MIQGGTVNGVLPFRIPTGLGTMVSPLLLDVGAQECDGECDGIGLRSGAAAGLGIGLFILGLLCGIAGTVLVPLVIKLCRSKSSKDAAVTYEKHQDEVIAT